MITHSCFLCSGATAHSDVYFGEGSGLIHLTFIKCSGLEYDVTDCETKNDSSHSLDVGVKCQPGMLSYCNFLNHCTCLLCSIIADEAYRQGDIRLVGGSYNWEGRVEIYWSGTWGAISDSSWTAAEASVVCRQLQHSGIGNFTYSCASLCIQFLKKHLYLGLYIYILPY